MLEPVSLEPTHCQAYMKTNTTNFLRNENGIMIFAVVCNTYNVVSGACCDVLLCVSDNTEEDCLSVGPLKHGTQLGAMGPSGLKLFILLFRLMINGYLGRFWEDRL